MCLIQVQPVGIEPSWEDDCVERVIRKPGYGRSKVLERCQR